MMAETDPNNISLYPHQTNCIASTNQLDKKCLVNMWCGTGKTRTFTVDVLRRRNPLNVIVFPSLGLINQYNNDYFLSAFSAFFRDFQCLSFCSDDESKLKLKSKLVKYSTSTTTLKSFIRNKDTNKIILVTYQSFEKFVNTCHKSKASIDLLIFDEAHHIVGDKIQKIVFHNEELDSMVSS